jgi:hypothetical protein
MSQTVEGGDHGAEHAVIEREEAEETQRVLSQAVENRSTVHWIFFILGCAVLLPWNGMFVSS